MVLINYSVLARSFVQSEIDAARAAILNKLLIQPITTNIYTVN